MQSETVEYHPYTRFEPHPRNMRRVYPRTAVRQMADSIEANLARDGPGIIQPLLGCRVGDGRIRIYAGNLRWHGAALLGKKAPPVPVILRLAGELDQMLDMAVENGVRFDPDPLSEALHYEALLDAGLSKNRIARELGTSLPTIDSRLKILALPETVQALFAEGTLPRLAAGPLLELDDPELQAAAARFLAEQNASLTVVKETCRRIAERMAEEPEPDESERSSTDEWKALSDQVSTAPTPVLVAVPPVAPAPFRELELLVRATCAACELGRKIETDVVWEDMRRAARLTCRGCDVRGLRDACRQCPLPDFLRGLRSVLEVRHGQ